MIAMKWLISILAIGLIIWAGCDEDAPVNSTADTEPPQVSISEPTNGASINGPAIVTIRATATDNKRVSRVDFYISSVRLATDDTFPFETVWNTTKLTPTGTYNIFAQGYDPSNNVGESDQISVYYSSGKTAD